MPFIDFALLKTEGMTSGRNNCWYILGGSIDLLEKRTELFTSNNIEWFAFGLITGFNTFEKGSDFNIAASLVTKLGYQTYKPDTLVFNGRGIEFDKSYYSVFRMNFNVKASYKSINLLFNAYSNPGNNMEIEGYKVELSYNIWKEIDAGKKEAYNINILKVYTNFRLYEFNTYKFVNDHVTYNHFLSKTLISAGISASLGSIKF